MSVTAAMNKAGLALRRPARQDRRMSDPRILRFFLDDDLRASARAGQHNFLNLVAEVARTAGFALEYRPDTPAERLLSATLPGYALWHMVAPTNGRGVTIRRVYHYPFWAIEPVAERWAWHVARSRFDPASVPDRPARAFADRWRRKLFPGMVPRDDGFVYIPLQGRLTQHRSFQSMSPLDMIRATLDHDPRPLVATLHPRETYDPAELQALHALAAAHPRLRVDTGGMERYLPACAAVVTQNSAVAFNGYFLAKPAVLFGRVDFHHIAANVADLGVAGAFAALHDRQPAFDRYLWWFWQKMSINAGRAEAPDQIAEALRRAGWPM